MEWLTTFHLASVILDPYTNESSWILRTATRILEPFRGSDARINLIVTSRTERCQGLPRPARRQFLVFCDPDRAVVKAIGLSELPAFAFIRVDGVVAACAQGWNPHEWGAVADAIAETTWWSSITVPGAERPGRVPRFAGPRLSGRGSARTCRPADVRSRPTSRDLPIVDALDDASPSAARPPTGDHRGAPRRRQDHRRAARPARRTVARRRSHRDARAAPPGHAGGGPAHGGDHADVGRRARRLPDPRRAAHRRDTRIEVVTEGVLTRRLQHDPELPGVGAVIFDEVHERNLTADLGLAFAIEVGGDASAPICAIVAMSATPDTAVCDVCSTHPVVTSDGRMFSSTSLAAAHAVAGRAGGDGCRRLGRPAAAVGAPTDRARCRRRGRRRSRDDGDVLVFLPGIGEIRRVERRCSTASRARSTSTCTPLAGALSLEEQDRALAPSPPGRRRVVLSTDIAETSLTVDGVRIVVDAGLAREPRFDARTGLSRLTTVTTAAPRPTSAPGAPGAPSRASPTGCGARSSTAPGRRHRSPEILQADLAGLALELAAWGTPRRARCAFIDPPPARGAASRRATLLDRRSVRSTPTTAPITDVGRAMLGCRCTPGWPAWSPARAIDALACVVAAHRRRARRAARPARRAARPTSRLRVGVVGGHGGHDARRPGRRAPACASGPPTSPAAPGCGSTLDSVDPTTPARRCSLGFPDRLAGRRRHGPVPAPHRRRGVGAPTTTRWRRCRSSSPPTSTASGRARASGSAAAVDAADVIAGVLDDVVEQRPPGVGRRPRRPRRRASSGGSARSASARTRAPPAPGDATTAALVARVRRYEARRADLDAGRRAAARAASAFLRARRSATTWPDLSDAGAAAHARRLAGAVPRPAPPAEPTSTGLDLATVLRRPAAVAARAPTSTSWRPPRWTCRPGGRCRSTTRPSDRPRRCGCRTCSGSRCTRRVGGRPVPLTWPCCRPPTGRSRSRPTCPGSGPGRGPTSARSWPGATPSTSGRPIPATASPKRLKDR